MDDRIVYCLVTKGGGVDGRDSRDRGGAITFASYNYNEVVEKHGPGAYTVIEKRVVDVEKEAASALAQLTTLQRLALKTKVEEEGVGAVYNALQPLRGRQKRK